MSARFQGVVECVAQQMLCAVTRRLVLDLFLKLAAIHEFGSSILRLEILPGREDVGHSLSRTKLEKNKSLPSSLKACLWTAACLQQH